MKRIKKKGLQKRKRRSFLSKLLIMTGPFSKKRRSGANSKRPIIKVYYFYHRPFGFIRSKIEKYVKESLNESFNHVSFELINVEKIDPKSIIKGYSRRGKALVIFNKNNNQFIVSTMRNRIQNGYDEKDIKEKFIKELKSMM
ncbi:MAG: hypothetical protein GY793_03460 [Proteobacteria bacterium]|nr:hypothetical protein [Pseudomonadota bacterium]